MRKILLAALALTAALTARAQTFTNVIAGSGIPTNRTLAQGILDYNNDGFEDLLLTLGPGANNERILKMFKNNGNGTFSDVTSLVQMPEIDSIYYLAVADLNNDGFKDIITIEGGKRIRVLCGSSSGAFEDGTTQSGFSLSGLGTPTSIRMGDLNFDGKIDLAFYRVRTDGQREIGYLKNGFGAGNASEFIALVPPFASNIEPYFNFFDFDSDNDLDIIVNIANTSISPLWGYYYHPIKTYKNQNGTFSEVPTISEINFPAGLWSYSDYNQDGFIDVFTGKPDYSPNSSLYLPVLKNNGNGTFTDVSTSIGFSSGTCYQSPPIETDFDLDGDLDYYNTSWGFGGCNGNLFFVNENGTFNESGAILGIRLNSGPNFNGATLVPYANFLDFDNDGDNDFFGGIDDYPNNYPLTSFLIKNNQVSFNKWLKVSLLGCQSGKDGFYSSVFVKVNGKRFYRIKQPIVSEPGIAPQSQLLHFGLGNASTIDSLVVKWPSGQTTVLTNVAVNQTLTVNEDNSCNAVSSNCPDLSGSLLQGLVGYWPFCGNANDESGNGNNGTVNGATLTADRFGNQGSAFQFDGINDYIESSNMINLTGNSPRTVSVWFKPKVFGPGWSTLLNFGEPCPNLQTSNTLQIDSLSGSTALNRIIFKANGENDDFFTTSLMRDSWYNYVWSFDGTNSKIYLNSTNYTNSPKSLNTTLTTVKLGFDYTSLNCPLFDQPYNQAFSGSLDDIAIWNRALNQSEITQLYNQGICKTSITVTDTLLIHTGITSYNPVAYQNTVKVWPNPGNQEITLDAGNLASMAGWKYKVANGLGQMVVNETAISQQQTNIDLSTWGGNGIYYLHLINPQGIAVEIKKIVLAP